MHKRDAVLRSRAEEEAEKDVNGNKFTDEPTISDEDYRLLQLMEKDQKPNTNK